MKISILCSDVNHPVNGYLNEWIKKNSTQHDIDLIRKKAELSSGKVLFLISCSEIILEQDRNKYDQVLVLHASDLPRGRGWSPHVWDIVNGAEHITLSLLEASDKVDSGRIWSQKRINVPKDALWDEVNDLLFTAEMEMMSFAVNEYDMVVPYEQNSEDATYFRKRTPLDSLINVDQSIASQFDKIRICDPNRFPAYIEYLGFKYKIVMEKI